MPREDLQCLCSDEFQCPMHGNPMYAFREKLKRQRFTAEKYLRPLSVLSLQPAKEVHEAYLHEYAWLQEELAPVTSQEHAWITLGQKACGVPPRSKEGKQLEEACWSVSQSALFKGNPSAAYENLLLSLTYLFYFCGMVAFCAMRGDDLLNINPVTEALRQIFAATFGAPEELDRSYEGPATTPGVVVTIGLALIGEKITGKPFSVYDAIEMVGVNSYKALLYGHRFQKSASRTIN